MTKHLWLQGDLLPGALTLNATAEVCCEACWIYFDPSSRTQCDVWVLDSKTSVCQLKNSTAASEFQAVPANRGSSYSSYTSGEQRDQMCTAVCLNLGLGLCSSARALQHIRTGSSASAGRKTAVLPSNATDVFTYTEPDV